MSRSWTDHVGGVCAALDLVLAAVWIAAGVPWLALFMAVCATGSAFLYGKLLVEREWLEEVERMDGDLRGWSL